MEKVSYLDLPDCLKLSNNDVEAIVTTHAGPRILRYNFTGHENVLGEVPDSVLKTELGELKLLGGHRLWVAPEERPRSYAPDSSPVNYHIEDERTVRLTAPVEAQTGIQKELRLILDEKGSGLTIEHTITNRGLWQIELAAWGITIMRGGGEVIIPQEPYRSWDETILPARPLVLWHYTDLTDPRWTLGKKFIRLRVDERMHAPQKIGALCKQSWAGYRLGSTVFVKRFSYEEGASYPDYNCNAEAYTAGSFIELESLSPLRRLAPAESVKHTERWHLFADLAAGQDEETLDAALNVLLTSVR